MCGIFTILNGSFTNVSPYWDNFGRPTNEYIEPSPRNLSLDRLSYIELYSMFLKGKNRGQQGRLFEHRSVKWKKRKKGKLHENADH